jgi:thiamine-phosphate pyrophosphorylase
VDAGRGEGGLSPRLFLVAPDDVPVARLVDCLTAACQAGDVASILVPAAIAKDITGPAQALGLAVLVSGEARDALRHGADGVQIDATTESVAEARAAAGKDHFVGAFAGASRHFAMEAAEAGADYVALSQNGASVGGEPIVKWWSSVMEIPCVAFEPVEPDGLDILLPQKPDFIRPADAMWQDAETSARIVTAIRQRLEAK